MAPGTCLAPRRSATPQNWSESMSETAGRQRSAIVFGARNLGRAVIEALVAEGWAVAGVARSQGTLDGIGEAGGLALQADVTDPASVHAALNEVAAAHGGVDLALNAASAYGGDSSGPFRGGTSVVCDFIALGCRDDATAIA